MSAEPFMRVTVSYVMLLGLTDDAVIDRDLALSHMENIAADLQYLSPMEKQEFRIFVSRLATLERERRSPQKVISFLETMCDNLNL